MKMFINFVVLIFVVGSARAQTCPDGETAFYKCNQKTKSCDVDSSMDCSKIRGTYYCCGKAEPKTHGNDQCRDTIPNCDDVEDLCNDEDVAELMKEQCRKTCNVCDEYQSKPKDDDEEEPNCRDTKPGCEKHLTLCNVPSFMDEMKEQCKKSCGILFKNQ
ncbi:hypothetical protein M3Y97_01102800 [Aphelenchoides bicaudatus]|nr:hypothetical protein M3Y97_01102800 [Aphelenchoides bicaudatus]